MPASKLSIATVLITLALNAHAADLREVYREAKKYDATFAAAEAQYRAGQEKADQGRALLGPSANVQVDVSHSNRDSAAVGPTPSSNTSGSNYGYTATVSQPLYRIANVVGNTQLQEQARLAEVSFHAAEQDLILRVAQAYFDVLLAQDNLNFVGAQKDATGQQLAQAKKNFEVGNATITDTNDAQAKYDAIIASEIAAENDLLVKKNAFLQLTGVPGDGLQGLSTAMKAVPPQPDDMNSWLTTAEQRSKQIDAKRGALAIASAEIEKYRALNQPTLDAYARYGDARVAGDFSRFSSDSTKTATVGLTLTVPLYTGGNTSSKLREALALRDQAQFDLEATRRSVAQNTKQGFLGVKSGAAQIKALEQALVSAQSSLDSTKLGKEVGVRTTLDVLNSQQQFFSTQRDLASARYTYLLNRLKLAQAVGELTDKDVDAVNVELRR